MLTPIQVPLSHELLAWVVDVATRAGQEPEVWCLQAIRAALVRAEDHTHEEEGR